MCINQNHIPAKKFKIFVPFQNSGQITDFFYFVSFWFRRKFEKKTKKTTFPKKIFNEIWLKLEDHKYINIAEINFG